MVTSQVQLKDIRVDRAARRISLVDLHAFLREGDASSAGSQLGKLINRPICSHLIYASKHKFSFLKQDNRRGKSIPAVISNSQLRLCILDIWNALLSSRKGTSKRLDGFRRQYLVLQSQFQTIFGSLWEDEVHDWPDLTTAPVPTSNAQRVHLDTLASSSRPSAAETIPSTPKDLHPSSTVGPSSPENIHMTTTESSYKMNVGSHAHSPGTTASNKSSSPHTFSISDQGVATSDLLKATKKYSVLNTQYLERFGSKPASHNLTSVKHQVLRPETAPLDLELGKYMHQVQHARWCPHLKRNPLEILVTKSKSYAPRSVYCTWWIVSDCIPMHNTA